MFRTFVVPLDGSDLAERAIPFAVKLVEAGRGRLILARVALAPAPMTLDGGNWEQDQLAVVNEAEQYLAGVAEKLGPEVPTSTEVAYGHAASEIVSLVTRAAADGVVMATHGRTGVAHLVYGSVAESILASSHVPVFLVNARPGQVSEPPVDPSTARVMVPLDGSAFAEAAVQTAVDFLGETGNLVLMTAVAEPDHVERDEHGRVLAYLDQQEEARTREAREYLQTVAHQLRDAHPKLDVGVDVRISDPEHGIAVAANARQADLIVMATHGRAGVRRAVVGSVAGAVLRAGHTPVLLVHPEVRPSVSTMVGTTTSR